MGLFGKKKTSSDISYGETYHGRGVIPTNRKDYDRKAKHYAKTSMDFHAWSKRQKRKRW